MARRHKAPRHSLTAPMRFIPRGDDAWDSDRIMREYKEIQATGGDLQDHPVWVYNNGWSRFDIDGTPGLAEYLDLTKKPEIWHIRRLKIEEVKALSACVSEFEQQAAAFAFGVVKVENCEEPKVAELFNAEKRASNRTIERVAFEYAHSSLTEVGAAVILACGDLTEPEKKVSGSPLGD